MRVILDHLSAPSLFGEFEVVHEQLSRKLTVHATAHGVTLLKIAHAAFKALVLNKVLWFL